MPLFYFDVRDGDRFFQDQEGTELPSLEAARAEALTTLGEIAKGQLPDGDRREFVISIRKGGPEPVLTASLLLRVGRAG